MSGFRGPPPLSRDQIARRSRTRSSRAGRRRQGRGRGRALRPASGDRRAAPLRDRGAARPGGVRHDGHRRRGRRPPRRVAPARRSAGAPARSLAAASTPAPPVPRRRPTSTSLGERELSRRSNTTARRCDRVALRGIRTAVVAIRRHERGRRVGRSRQASAQATQVAPGRRACRRSPRSASARSGPSALASARAPGRRPPDGGRRTYAERSRACPTCRRRRGTRSRVERLDPVLGEAGILQELAMMPVPRPGERAGNAGDRRLEQAALDERARDQPAPGVVVRGRPGRRARPGRRGSARGASRAARPRGRP